MISTIQITDCKVNKEITVENMENKERPKCQKLSRDAGPDMNADGEPACEVSENKDPEYIN